MPVFDSVSGAAAGRKGHAGKGRRPRNQVIALQRAAVDHALSGETPVGVVASLMRAYVDLQELRMNLEGIGKPRPVDAVNATPKRKLKSISPITRQEKSVSEPASDACSNSPSPGRP